MKHVARAVGIYVEAVHPRVVYIDDDLRFDNHGAIQYGCFCGRCLKGFNDKRVCKKAAARLLLTLSSKTGIT